MSWNTSINGYTVPLPLFLHPFNKLRPIYLSIWQMLKPTMHLSSTTARFIYGILNIFSSPCYSCHLHNTAGHLIESSLANCKICTETSTIPACPYTVDCYEPVDMCADGGLSRQSDLSLGVAVGGRHPPPSNLGLARKS